MNYFRVISAILLIILLETILFGCNNSSELNGESLKTQNHINKTVSSNIKFSIISTIYDSETFTKISGASIKINDSITIYADSKGMFQIKDFNIQENTQLKLEISSPYYNTQTFFINPENNIEIHSEFLISPEKTDLIGKITLNLIAVECQINIDNQTVNTRKDGSFKLKDINCGEKLITISRNNRIYVEKNFLITKNTDFLELELSSLTYQNDFTVKNIVTDEQDNPLSQIIVYSEDSKWVTDKNGIFSFQVIDDNLKNKKITLVDPTKKYLDKIENITFSVNNNINIIKLKKIISEKDNSKISGMVFSNSKKIHNSLEIEFKNTNIVKKTNTHDDGWFDIDLEEGEYTLTIKDPLDIFKTHTQKLNVNEDSEYISVKLYTKK
ncbi:MAG: hypothetical protein M0R46_05720 [Candidatus Muirbacterium halophilum]|nr:hypothetical protein [Candidatus Muirbacterium halophilum]MCK9475394.1 hypothetical protein [Candidatus Muirbacterium halophilum]